jgi:hypothetical protein
MKVIEARHQRGLDHPCHPDAGRALCHMIGDSTYVDAVLDRLLQNAYRIDLTGDSMRRRKPFPCG